MEKETYLVVTIKQWNINAYNKIISKYNGIWHLITDINELTVEKVKVINPKFIFFPHWSHIVPSEILNISTCICFHETDLPYGRGGSPLQNLIALGHKETEISALQMTEELDAGPIYLKKGVSLEGLAEEIYIRISYIVADMIKIIIEQDIKPIEQNGKITLFNRRKPKESKIPSEKTNLEDLFDHIRMLDAEGYPNAYLEIGNFRYELFRPSLKSNKILADVRITKLKENIND